MNLFTRNSSYCHLLKYEYLLFLLKHPVYTYCHIAYPISHKHTTWSNLQLPPVPYTENSLSDVQNSFLVGKQKVNCRAIKV
jgi:hypothetical protein